MSAEDGQQKNRPYNPSVSRKPRRGKGPRPKQGARLVALRQAAGLTQIELAEALGVAHANITLWEWSDKPPRASLLMDLAEILGVTVEDLLGAPQRKRRKQTGPVGEVEKTFEEVRSLPRSQQKKILETVNALVNEYKRRRAS